MAILLAVLIVSTYPVETTLVDYVDVIEQNHVYDSQGREVFTQWIFWRWTGSRYEVVGWRINKHNAVISKKRVLFGDTPASEYYEDFNVKPWVRERLLLWDNTIVREVRAISYRETWTQYDPEMLDRMITPVEARVGLTRNRFKHD
jgi:hypothetical protein